MQSLFTFCKTRWARREKTQRKHATEVTKNQKYGMNETIVSTYGEFRFHFNQKKILSF